MYMNFTFTRLLKQAKALSGYGLVLLLMLALFSNTPAYAGGRPVGKKRLFIIATSSYYFANKFWDENGNAQPYTYNGKYSTLSLTINAEYGLSRRVSLSASIPYSANFFNSTAGNTTNAALGDASVGMSYYIANIAYRTFFSVQANFLFPLYQNSLTADHGYGELAGNTQFLAAGDFKLWDKSFSFGANVGASQYFGSLAPFQLTFGGSLGFTVSKKNQVSLSETTATSYSPSKAFDPNSPVPAKDYTYNELTATFAHNISRRRSLFFSATRFINGKNTGIGNTVSVGYTYKY